MGDPVEDTGSPAQEPDNQEREEMFESPNSEVARGSDVQSTPGHQASVSGQKQGHGGDSCLFVHSQEDDIVTD